MSPETLNTGQARLPIPLPAFQACMVSTSYWTALGGAHWAEMYQHAYETARQATAVQQFRWLTQVSAN